jgi:hypothetical protein
LAKINDKSAMGKLVNQGILILLVIASAVSFSTINQLEIHPSIQIYLLVLVAQSLVAAVIFWRKK